MTGATDLGLLECASSVLEEVGVVAADIESMVKGVDVHYKPYRSNQ